MRYFLMLLLAPSLAFANPFAKQDYVALYAGYFGLGSSDEEAVQLGAEYRFEEVYFDAIRPAIGVNVTDEGAVYGYGGLFWDLMLDDHWIVTPNFVAGAFHHGDGKDLGHGLQFRSGVELNYQFEEGQRIGLAFNHISNAGLGDKNPGAETLMLVFQHPLD